MSRLRVAMREIGSVKVFDLLGEASQEGLQEVAWKIQRSIRRHRLQRVILNVQKIKTLDEVGIRKLVAAFIRPQKGAIYGASPTLVHQLEDTYLPRNLKICRTEKEVAEDFGPFLFHKEERGKILGEKDKPHLGNGGGPGVTLERRRAKRMHVAIPLEITLYPKGEGAEPIRTPAIATNISHGGVFIEYLDLEALEAAERLDPIEGVKAEIQIHPSENFPEEYQLEGVIRRKEMRHRGLGIAVEFTSASHA